MARISMLVLCGLPIFVILFAVISTALKQTSLFGRNTAVVVALCTALLCVIGLYRTFLPPDAAKDLSGRSNPMGVDFVLLPYAVLGIAILLMLLLLMFSGRRTRRDKLPKATKDMVRRAKSACGLRDRRVR
jgi:Flp pilus assembly protein TadB